MSLGVEAFLALPVARVASLVREREPLVCVFPINGTRRWFMLEHAHQSGDDPVANYMEIASRNHIDLYRLFFDHGVDTLLTPAFGPDLLQRGDEYVQRIGAAGLARLASDPLFLDFYEAFQVRVRFYGDHRKFLRDTPLAYLSDLFDEAQERTQKYARFRLFFGVFAHDATRTIAELAVAYFQRHGQIPDRQDLIALYYGEVLPPVNVFIGFDKFNVFDYPLLATGEEDLYFTVAPSPYLGQEQLRRILFDHLFTRRVPEPDYSSIPEADHTSLRQFYTSHLNKIFGLGTIRAGLWLPEE